MIEKVTPVTRVLEDSFVYSCTFKQQRGYEQFVPYHVLAFQFSGEPHIQHLNGRLLLKKNQILLAQKNQLVAFVFQGLRPALMQTLVNFTISYLTNMRLMLAKGIGLKKIRAI